jgi:hypothetical protein
MRWEYLGTGLTFFTIGLALVLALPPPWWPKMPPLLIKLGLYGGLALIVFGSAVSAMGVWPDILRPRAWPILAIAIGVFFVVGGAIWFSQIEVKPRDKIGNETLADVPDVTLLFVYPDYPALVLSNNSNKVAAQIKWTVVLWNLDDPKSYSNSPGSPPDTHEPLPIPVQTFDYIRAHSTGGPQNLFGLPSVAPHVSKGNRLVGSASVACPDCARGHTYLVSIVFGEGGWYSEMAEMESGSVVVPPKFTKQSVADFAQLVLATPLEKRITIAQPHRPTTK